MTRTEEINQMLYAKLSKEFNDFVENLKTLPPTDIIKNSYSKVFKEDNLMCFHYGAIEYETA